MLSIEACKEILNKGKKKYKDEEVKLIREYLYLIGELEIENDNNKENNILKVNTL